MKIFTWFTWRPWKRRVIVDQREQAALLKAMEILKEVYGMNLIFFESKILENDRRSAEYVVEILSYLPQRGASLQPFWCKVRLSVRCLEWRRIQIRLYCVNGLVEVVSTWGLRTPLLLELSDGKIDLAKSPSATAFKQAQKRIETLASGEH